MSWLTSPGDHDVRVADDLHPCSRISDGAAPTSRPVFSYMVFSKAYDHP